MALVALGRALLGVRTEPALRPLQAKFQSVDEKLLQRTSIATALEDADTARASLATQHAEELAALREARQPFAERAQLAGASLRQADADLGRAEALAKRAEIAVRALKQAASPPATTRLDDLESALAERKSELDLVRTARARSAALAQAEHAALDAELAKEQNAVQKHALALADADKRKSALGKRVALVGASEEAAFRALALAARELKLAGLARAACDNADKCARLVDAIKGDLERAARAMALVHARSVWNGVAVIAGCLALFALAVFS